MSRFSAVPAPGPVKLVKAVLLAAGLLAVLGAVRGDPTGPARWGHLASGVVFVVAALALRRGRGSRVRISVLLVVNAVVQAALAVATGQLVDLFGVLLPLGLLAWANSAAARAWFAAGTGRERAAAA